MRRLMTTQTGMRLWLLWAATLLSLVGALATPAALLASCVLPNYAAHMADPSNVVVAGTVLQVAPERVTIAVQRWWGEGAAPSVVIERPPTDPNVITSVDWTPQPGEAYVILTHREGAGLITRVCEQLPGTPETAQEVASALGEGIAPVSEVAPSPPEATPVDQVAPEGPGLLALAVVALAALIAAGALFAITRMRRSSR